MITSNVESKDKWDKFFNEIMCFDKNIDMNKIKLFYNLHEKNLLHIDHYEEFNKLRKKYGIISKEDNYLED